MYQKFTPFYNNILHRDSDSIKIKKLTKHDISKLVKCKLNEANIIGLNDHMENL